MAQVTSITVKMFTELKDSSKNFETFLQELEKLRFSDDMYRDDPLPQAASKTHYALKELQNAACQIKDTGERVLRRLNQPKEHYLYSGVSGLGELQSRGPSFDILCALYVREFKDYEAAVRARFQFEYEQERIKLRAQYKDVPLWVLNVLRSEFSNGDATALQIVKAINQAGEQVSLLKVQVAIDLLLMEKDPFIQKSGAKHYRLKERGDGAKYNL